MSEKYKTIRAVVECRVPQRIAEKALVQHLKDILKWPIQVGHKGDPETNVRTEIKSYSRIRAAELKRESEFWSYRRMNSDA